MRPLVGGPTIAIGLAGLIVTSALCQYAIADDLEKKLREHNPGFEDFSKDVRHEFVNLIRNQIKASSKFMEENGQHITQFSSFLTECTSRINGGNDTVIPTCDSGVQKWNAEIGQFFVDKEYDINRLIYPKTLPNDIPVGPYVSHIIGTSDRTAVSEHVSTGSNYTSYLGQISSKCDGLFKSYKVEAYSTCAPLVEKLNSHLKSFLGNSTNEFSQILVS